MFKFLKAARYQYYWEKLISHVNIYDKRGCDPHITIFKGSEFEVCCGRASPVTKKFPMTTDGFKRAIEWIGLKEELYEIEWEKR